MFLKTSAFTAAAIVLLTTATPGRAETFTLSEALAVAYDTNPQLAQSRAALAALDQGVAQADAGWRPTLAASASSGYNHGIIAGVPRGVNTTPVTAQVSLSEPLFRGGRTEAEINRAIAQVHAGRAQLAATEQSVLLAAVTAYMDVVRDTESVKLNFDNRSSLQRELNGVREQFAAGEVTKTDVLQAEARLARAQSDSAIAESQLIASRAAFENVIGRPAETLESEVLSPRLPVSKETALALALKENPNLLQARANEQAAKFAVDDAVGALLPDVAVTGQYQFLREAPSASAFGLPQQQEVASVMAQINVPIYQGGAEEASVRRAKDLRHESELAILTADHDVRENLDSVWQSLISLKDSIEANKAQATADENAFGDVRQEQQAGERSVIDVLNAQQELFAAQIALVSAQHDQIVAAYRLLSVAGVLNARSLGLKVTLYDPLQHYNENANAWFGFGE